MASITWVMFCAEGTFPSLKEFKLTWLNVDLSLKKIILCRKSNRNYVSYIVKMPNWWLAEWPDLAKFRHFGNILWIFVKWLRIYSVFGKNFNLLWQKCYTFGQPFNVVNGQILKNKIAISSLWLTGYVQLTKCRIQWNLVITIMSEGQRPRNYSSCCCCSCWIFCLIYALSTPTIVLPPIF